jgi:nucleoside permease NupC
MLLQLQSALGLIGLTLIAWALGGRRRNVSIRFIIGGTLATCATAAVVGVLT